MGGQQILLLVPHPDDEVVAASASIGRAQAQGATIKALYLTHGCVAEDVLWPWQRSRYGKISERRWQEGVRVAKELNLQTISFSSRPARHVWRDLKLVYQEIDDAVRSNTFDELWTPAFEGGNPDHDATNALASLFQDRCRVLEFAEYNYCNGQKNSHQFPKPNGTETEIVLNEKEQNKKRSLLNCYQSEKLNLNYVNTNKECFRPLATYNYTLPPHEGTLWYERFQWVPFAHPGVDFTKAIDVAEALGTFLKNFSLPQQTILSAS